MTYLDQAWEFSAWLLQTTTNAAVHWWAGTSNEELAIFSLVILIAVCSFLLGRDYPKLPWRKRKMGYGTKTEMEKAGLADAITLYIEDQRPRKKMTDERARYWYQRAADDLGLTELSFRNERRPAKLKHEIQTRLANGFYKTKPKIPGDPPPPVMRNIYEKKEVEPTQNTEKKSFFRRLLPA